MFVYFIQRTTGGLVKIGKSQKPDLRLATLQEGCPEPLKILGVCAGGYAAEKQLHRWFADQRRSGEWFEPNEAMAALISRLPTWESVRNGAFCPELLNNERTVLKELYLAGYTLDDIGNLLGLSRARVHQLVSDWSETKPRRMWTYDPVSKRSFLTVDINKGRSEARPDEPIKAAYERLTKKHSGIDLVLPDREAQ